MTPRIAYHRDSSGPVTTCTFLTSEFFISMFSRGILTCSNLRKPLSMESQPNLGPISPTVIPVNRPKTNPDQYSRLIQRLNRQMHFEQTITPQSIRGHLPQNGATGCSTSITCHRPWSVYQGAIGPSTTITDHRPQYVYQGPLAVVRLLEATGSSLLERGHWPQSFRPYSHPVMVRVSVHL